MKTELNNLIVISGPSGAGKSTLIRRLLEANPRFHFSVSHTTRPPRPGEENGREYFFTSRDAFTAMIARQEFAEWARVHDHYYGTSHREIEKKSKGEQILVLDVDVQGARSIREAFPSALMIFVVPPSLDVLKERLQGREQIWNEALDQRMRTAIEELREYSIYDYLVVNDEMERAFESVQTIVAAYPLRMERQRGIIDRLLGEQP